MIFLVSQIIQHNIYINTKENYAKTFQKLFSKLAGTKTYGFGIEGRSGIIVGRLYDKEGQGFITTETLRGLIAELLAPLTDEELDGIIDELDEDGSGSMDFDEFCEMMMTHSE